MWGNAIGNAEMTTELYYLKTKCNEIRNKVSKLCGENLGDLNILELQSLLNTQKVFVVLELLFYYFYGKVTFVLYIVAWSRKNSRSIISIWRIMYNFFVLMYRYWILYKCKNY